MPVEIRVPEAGESITEVEIGAWLKSVGDEVAADEPLVEIETDKVSMEIPAPAGGALSAILKQAGDTAEPGEVIGYLAEAPARAGEERPPPDRADQAPQEQAAGAGQRPPGGRPEPSPGPRIMPAVQRLLKAHRLNADEIEGSGPGGRLLKEDVLRHLEQRRPPQAAAGRAPMPPASPLARERQEEAVPLSRLRRTIAEQLVAVQQNAALLTTFNEVDMAAVIQLRKQYRDAFEEKHGVRLGFMSFFVKAVVDALQRFPALNGEIRDGHIIYKNYYDIGIAIGGGRGLVVPVLRDADRMAFAGIEKAIGDFARRAQSNDLTLEELQGGTFTITNGGVYGSLLSTPIVNPPQSGILGMHAIQERPVAIDGNVVVRPLMYVALTYDHRIVDGREAVTFLRRIKECVEDPVRMLIEV